MSEKLIYDNLTKKVSDKIANSIVEFIIKDKLTFYGYFLQNVNFYQTEKIETAGVNFKGLRMNFYYNNKFVESLSKKQIKFLCIHEIFHLLFNHPKRGHGYVHELANIAMDMIINEIIIEKHCNSEKGENGLEKSIAEFIPGCVKMDSHYKDDRMFEVLYNWVNEKYFLWKEKYGEENKKMILDNLAGKSSIAKENDGIFVWESDKKEGEEIDVDKIFSFDFSISDERKRQNEELGIDEETRRLFEGGCSGFDVHFWDDIDEEMRNQIVKRHIDNLRARGFMSSDSEDVLGRLIKKKNNSILKLLKRGISALKGFHKTSSYRKPNRKDLDGLKGKIKYANEINCILDTSGSMSGSFETVVSEIFKDDFVINMIQCDSEIKDYIRITNKNQLTKMKIKGLGGTSLQPGIDYIMSDRDLRKNNLVILSDGFTDTLNFSKCPSTKVLILTVAENCPLAGHYKNVSHLKVEPSNKKN